MAENTEIKELRAQIACLSSSITSVKGKTLKITPDVLGLPVKPVCRNCSKNAGGPNDHACYMEITWSTAYTNPLTRRMLSDANGILHDTDRGRQRELLTQTPISIYLIPGDKVIVQSATFMCTKQFIHSFIDPLSPCPGGKYINDVKNFVQEAFDKLCPEVSQQLETNSSVNMEEYMEKYSGWVKQGIEHAAREGCNAAIRMSHNIRDFTSSPPKMIATQQNSLNIVSESIPQNKYFRLVNKQSSQMLNMDGTCKSKDDLERGRKVSPDSVSWTLEPVE